MSGKMYDFSKFAKDATPVQRTNIFERGWKSKAPWSELESQLREAGASEANLAYFKKQYEARQSQLKRLSPDTAFGTDPPVSEAQRKAMFAAKAGKSNLGIPQKVGAEFAKADPGGKLPEKKK